MRRIHLALFAAALFVSLALCWQAGLRMPRILPVSQSAEQVTNATIMAISNAANSQADCSEALAEVRRLCGKALTGQLAGQR